MASIKKSTNNSTLFFFITFEIINSKIIEIIKNLTCFSFIIKFLANLYIIILCKILKYLRFY